MRIALISFGSSEILEHAAIAKAIQEQIHRDFAPHWGVDATLCCARHDSHPRVDFSIALASNDQREPPVCGKYAAIVPSGPLQSLDTSQAILEFISNPDGTKVFATQHFQHALGSVWVSVRVCEPCRSDQLAYTIDGIRVCNFCTPEYFSPNGVSFRFDFTGSIQAPFSLAPGGSITWKDLTSGIWCSMSIDDDAIEHRLRSERAPQLRFRIRDILHRS